MPDLGPELLDPALRTALAKAWEAPEQAQAVQALWQPVAPGVYLFPFFEPARLAELRDYLQESASEGVPTRPRELC